MSHYYIALKVDTNWEKTKMDYASTYLLSVIFGTISHAGLGFSFVHHGIPVRVSRKKCILHIQTFRERESSKHRMKIYNFEISWFEAAELGEIVRC